MYLPVDGKSKRSLGARMQKGMPKGGLPELNRVPKSKFFHYLSKGLKGDGSASELRVANISKRFVYNVAREKLGIKTPGIVNESLEVPGSLHHDALTELLNVGSELFKHQRKRKKGEKRLALIIPTIKAESERVERKNTKIVRDFEDALVNGGNYLSKKRTTRSTYLARYGKNILVDKKRWRRRQNDGQLP